ncbi:hypothetical protein HID58_064288 [Brassica napus]|uniref:Mitochondrial import inner membrane translocase subunit TIM22 n=1 Tax=Brassica napus TaxID=3708 RepID=A0ABQ7Z9T3_BRANA|nr:hypothetical protein HID58_064288 [Brassica napus]
MRGFRLGIEHIMKGIRGKDDLTAAMVSASGGGLAYTFVSKGLKVKPAHALSWAVCYAVASGTMKQSEQEVNIPPAPGARLLILDHIKRFVYKLLY